MYRDALSGLLRPITGAFSAPGQREREPVSLSMKELTGVVSAVNQLDESLPRTLAGGGRPATSAGKGH